MYLAAPAGTKACQRETVNTLSMCASVLTISHKKSSGRLYGTAAAARSDRPRMTASRVLL